MIGWVVFGVLGAVFAAELYVMYKNEEECDCNNDDEIEVVDSLEKDVEEEQE